MVPRPRPAAPCRRSDPAEVAVTILGARGLRRTYGTRDVLKDATLSVADRERVGLVGRNGSGKSTLAKILAGLEAPDAGEVTRKSGLRMGYLSQTPELPTGARAIDVVLAGLASWQAAVALHTELSAKLERAEGDLDALLIKQAAAATQVEVLGGWSMRHEAETILDHVGILDPEALVDPMSGGEKRRIALAQILVAAPELAILDEPTNHLDVDAVQWLEMWLMERMSGALVLITHDRYLLDRVVSRTLEVDDGEVYSYDGGWSLYLEAKAERMAHADRAEANRRNFLRREVDWLRRSPAARTTKQKARIDRAEAAIAQGPAKVDRTAAIAMDSARSGNMIIEAESVAVDIAGRRLVDGLTLRLSEGERIGILGPNGCGKTSLLRVLTGKVPPSAGVLRHGKNTRIAYLDQERSGLDETGTVYDNVAGDGSRIELGGETMEVRSYLERFLFTAQDQRQKVSTLSGGERARVALARLLRDGANVIVLDEPTNDLDVMTLGALEQALVDYAGTLLVVTHDRWFLDRVATSILAFEGSPNRARVTQYQGGWTDWSERRAKDLADAARAAAVARPTAVAPTAKPVKKNGLTFSERHELDSLMDRVEAAEQAAHVLEQETCDAGFYTRPRPEQADVERRLAAARDVAAGLIARWTALEERRNE